jgi:hypothetical protein
VSFVTNGTESGCMFAWGDNEFGQLCVDLSDTRRPASVKLQYCTSPRRTERLDCLHVVLGFNHGVGLTGTKGMTGCVIGTTLNDALS